MKGLEGCVKDMKGEGFFAADIKMPTGSDRKKQVFAANYMLRNTNPKTIRCICTYHDFLLRI